MGSYEPFHPPKTPQFSQLRAFFLARATSDGFGRDATEALQAKRPPFQKALLLEVFYDDCNNQDPW